MSIAVSAVVRRSVMFSRICHLAAAAVLAIAGGIAASPPMSINQLSLVAIPLLLAVVSFYMVYRSRRFVADLRLVIQADGRLLVTLPCSTGDAHSSGSKLAVRTVPVRSIAGSTLLPCLLLLRLHLENAATTNVLIFQDSVSADEFKRLSVALHWIAGRNDPAQCELG
jgi:presenilin-like A22 family membrane protease